jgi:hypothetical protein
LTAGVQALTTAAVAPVTATQNAAADESAPATKDRLVLCCLPMILLRRFVTDPS